MFSPNNQEARLVELTDVGLDGIADLDIAQVVEYWTAQSAGRMAPPLSDFHLDDISPPLLPRMSVLDFIGDPFDFRYRFFGIELVRLAGADLTGKTHFADGVVLFGNANIKLLPRMIAEKRPFCHRVVWQSNRGSHFTLTTARMPLSNDGTEITGAVTATYVAP